MAALRRRVWRLGDSTSQASSLASLLPRVSESDGYQVDAATASRSLAVLRGRMIVTIAARPGDRMQTRTLPPVPVLL
jgi:hypothetical protein